MPNRLERVGRWAAGALVAGVIFADRAQPTPVESSQISQTPPIVEDNRPVETEAWREGVSVDSLGVGSPDAFTFASLAHKSDTSIWWMRIPHGYVASWNGATQKVEWRFMGMKIAGIKEGNMAMNTADSNIFVAAGRKDGTVNDGMVQITRDGGRSSQEIAVSGLGAVKGTTISKDGNWLYLSTDNNGKTAGTVVKIDLATGAKVDIANNGLTGNVGRRILASPNDNNTVYTISPDGSAVLRSTDGGQNWSTLFTTGNNPQNDSFSVVNWQGQDAVLAGGALWNKIQVGGSMVMFDQTAYFVTATLDNNGLEPRMYGAAAVGFIRAKSPSESDWTEVSSSGLPTDSWLRKLSMVKTPDGKRLLICYLENFTDSAKDSGVWIYDLSHGETSGTWVQGSDGLAKFYSVMMPLVVQNWAGGW